MTRTNCLVKISGDALHGNVLEWIRGLSAKHHVVICVGGGTQINEAFMEAGLPVGKFGPLGRETQTLQERQLARDVLERNQAEIQDKLAAMGIHISVVIPVLDIGTVLCHVNGDQFVLAAYHGFGSIYVVTTIERLPAKVKFFAPYDKISVVAFPQPESILSGNRSLTGGSSVSYTTVMPISSSGIRSGSRPFCPRDYMGIRGVTGEEVAECPICDGVFDHCPLSASRGKKAYDEERMDGGIRRKKGEINGAIKFF